MFKMKSSSNPPTMDTADNLHIPLSFLYIKTAYVIGLVVFVSASNHGIRNGAFEVAPVDIYTLIISNQVPNLAIKFKTPK